jgi:hypothetical protein
LEALKPVAEGDLVEAESMNLILKTLNALYDEALYGSDEPNLDDVPDVVMRGELITTSSDRITKLKTMFNNMLNY